MRYVMVAGEGDTSRENVEAILEDYFYANKGEEMVMVVPFMRAPSRGQVYAMQMAKDNKSDVIVFAPESARLENIEKSTIEFTDTPVQGAVDLIRGTGASAYILCSDEGHESFEALQACKDADVASYDLTAGGIPLTSSVEAPVAPTKVAKAKPKPEAIQEALDNLVAAITESVLNGR